MINIPDKPPIYSYSHSLRSRYSETDKMGYVYYGRYLEFFEVARTEMIRSLGLPYSKMEKDGIMLPVIFSGISYKSPIFYDEEMNVKVMLFEPPLVRLDTWYQVYTGRSEAPHVEGQVTLAFLDSKTRRPRRAPEYFLDQFDY